MAALTEWLQLMLAEIARKREDQELANAEDIRRASETQSNSPTKEAHATRG